MQLQNKTNWLEAKCLLALTQTMQLQNKTDLMEAMCLLGSENTSGNSKTKLIEWRESVY
jgi:hypothetical protein